jgi:hypothetical protein
MTKLHFKYIAPKQFIVTTNKNYKQLILRVLRQCRSFREGLRKGFFL